MRDEILVAESREVAGKGAPACGVRARPRRFGFRNFRKILEI